MYSYWPYWDLIWLLCKLILPYTPLLYFWFILYCLVNICDSKWDAETEACLSLTTDVCSLLTCKIIDMQTSSSSCRWWSSRFRGTLLSVSQSGTQSLIRDRKKVQFASGKKFLKYTVWPITFVTRFCDQQGPDSGAKILALKTALKMALKMALDFLHWKKSENG